MDSFQSMLPVSEWNKSIEVTLAGPIEVKFSAYVVRLLVTNRSQDDISFAADYGAKALVYSDADKAWSEVGNEMTYGGNGETLVPRDSPDSNWAASVVVVPSVPQLSEGDLMRVAVVGRVVVSGVVTDRTVGAYVDIEPRR